MVERRLPLLSPQIQAGCVYQVISNHSCHVTLRQGLRQPENTAIQKPVAMQMTSSLSVRSLKDLNIQVIQVICFMDRIITIFILLYLHIWGFQKMMLPPNHPKLDHFSIETI